MKSFDKTNRAASQRRKGTEVTVEKTLFAAADKMRGSIDLGEYKHVVLGLFFLH